MTEFCHRHNSSKTFPTNPRDFYEAFRHLLYDDAHKIVFCFVPKNGCTNIKGLLAALNRGTLLNLSKKDFNKIKVCMYAVKASFVS